MSEQMEIAKEPCPHCGRGDYRWVGETWVGEFAADRHREKRCDYCAPMRMDAYYYSFGRTGQELVDRILSAVARAGKGYHHTDGWQEPVEDWGPFRGGDYVAWIQNAANDAAEALAQRDALLAALKGLVKPLAKGGMYIDLDLQAEMKQARAAIRHAEGDL